MLRYEKSPNYEKLFQDNFKEGKKMTTDALEKVVVAAVTITAEQAVKLTSLWTSHVHSPQTVEDWLTYLPRLRAEKRRFPDIERVDILSSEMSTYAYFLVCKALEKNSQEELSAAFAFLDQLKIQQNKQRAETRLLSFSKMGRLKDTLSK